MIEPQNYLDIENNPTFLGMREMREVLEDMARYCLAICKANDLTLPREVRQLHLAEAKQHTRLAMFCSRTGLGRTFLGRRILRKAGLKLPPHELVPTNVASLTYETWKLVRSGYEVAPIDDADRLMRSDSMIGVMKGGWNKDDPTINCHVTERIRKNEEYRRDGSPNYNPDVPPPSFPYTLATPWFANKNLATASGLAEHTHPDFSALIARGLHPRWIDLHPRNVFFYVLWMIERSNLFVSINLTLAEAEETLAAYMDAALRLNHPNPNLTLAINLAQARKNPEYKTLGKRIILQSLEENEGQPRAITEPDLKLRPELRRAVEAGRAEAARRKAAADHALAEAREAARLAEELAAARLAEARKFKSESEDVPEEVPVFVAAKEKTKYIPSTIPPAYSPPPGHVFPPAYTDKFQKPETPEPETKLEPAVELAPTSPEPGGPDPAPKPDRQDHIGNPISPAPENVVPFPPNKTQPVPDADFKSEVVVKSEPASAGEVQLSGVVSDKQSIPADEQEVTLAKNIATELRGRDGRGLSPPPDPPQTPRSNGTPTHRPAWEIDEAGWFYRGFIPIAADGPPLNPSELPTGWTYALKDGKPVGIRMVKQGRGRPKVFAIGTQRAVLEAWRASKVPDDP